MIRYIVLQKIIELESFTKAAESMGYTQSSVSQMIASLERELGIKLLVRSRSKIALTPEGKELYPYIERTINQYRGMLEKVDEIKGLETGSIRIGLFSSISYQWMPDLVKGFQETYPNVQFVFYQGDYSSIATWIKTGAVDFGFVTPPAASGLQMQVLPKGEMLVVMQKNDPLARKETITLQDIAETDFILLEEGAYNETRLAFQKEGIEPHIKFMVHDDFTIMKMVEKGMGVSILAELMTRQAPYDIVTRPLTPPLYRELAVAYKDKNILPVASKRFLAYMFDRLRQNDTL